MTTRRGASPKEANGRPFWRPLRQDDMAAVMAIATALHPEARERAEVFEEKRRLSPGNCFALQFEHALVGYLISHPWRQGDIPPLDAFLGGLPDTPDCLYLHDIAILAEARGCGCAAAAIERLADNARRMNLHALALVSLYGTDALWGRLGFVPIARGALSAGLGSYGENAVYMRAEV